MPVDPNVFEPLGVVSVVAELLLLTQAGIGATPARASGGRERISSVWPAQSR